MPQKNKFAFVFPGQGSQSVGMLSPLAEDYPLIIETFSEASNALGFDLWELVKNGPESELNKTEITQPALLTAGVAMWRLWEDAGGGRPEVMAGHSLSEYTALVCSEVITFADTVALVAERGANSESRVVSSVGCRIACVTPSEANLRKYNKCIHSMIKLVAHKSGEASVLSGTRRGQ